MFSASKTNSLLKESYEELGKITVKFGYIFPCTFFQITTSETTYTCMVISIKMLEITKNMIISNNC